jgi:hypothetical protein
MSAIGSKFLSVLLKTWSSLETFLCLFVSENKCTGPKNPFMSGDKRSLAIKKVGLHPNESFETNHWISREPVPKRIFRMRHMLVPGNPYNDANAIDILPAKVISF